MKQIIDATKNPVRDEISVENSRKSVRIPSGMTYKRRRYRVSSLTGFCRTMN
ncbi:MAG: hypothetical protein LBK58_15355 [Prevotellaceae bacterium]|nr:hypothetical protein [Prevotellaceae bacterium]